MSSTTYINYAARTRNVKRNKKRNRAERGTRARWAVSTNARRDRLPATALKPLTSRLECKDDGGQPHEHAWVDNGTLWACDKQVESPPVEKDSELLISG